jgi:hypothetical protein
MREDPVRDRARRAGPLTLLPHRAPPSHRSALARGATRSLPWTAAVVTSQANRRPCDAADRRTAAAVHGDAPPERRSLAVTEIGDARSIASRLFAPAGGAMGRAGPRAHPGGPPPRRQHPRATTRGPPGERVAGSPVETGPAATASRPPAIKRHPNAGAKKTKGAGEGPDALRHSNDWNMRPARDVARPVGPVRRRARGWPGVDSLDGSSLVRPSGRPPPGSRKN